MLRILYRTVPAENSKRRPTFYSKRTCFKSLLRALKHVEGTLHILCDAPSAPAELLDLAGNRGTVSCLGGVGNAASFEYALNAVRTFSSEDLIYFVEDDYLHLPEALVRLEECSELVPAEYITLYDHPVRYQAAGTPDADWPLRVSKTYEVKGFVWRTVESTCMTFAATAGTIADDRSVFVDYVVGRRHPLDRELFRQLQGLGRYADYSPRRLLVGPIPSLATHCELPWLAPAIDWEAIARATQT